MNQDKSEFERQLASRLDDLAPSPRSGQLEHVIAAVEATAQRAARPRWLPAGFSGEGWARAGSTLTVAGLGVALGVLIGTYGLRPVVGDPSATSTATKPIQTAGAPTPSEDAGAYDTWEMIDMPDPAPGVFGGGFPFDVLAFRGEYVAVGSVQATCFSDIHEPPPGCDEALSALRPHTSSVVWVSSDGRSWDLLPHQDAFLYSAMEDAATDGSRIVVSGWLFRMPDGTPLRPRRPVVWISEDARTWELVDSSGVVPPDRPEQIVWTSNGFIGARSTFAGPMFMSSADGRAWEALTQPGELGPGDVYDLAVGDDGTTVVAVGSMSDGQDDQLTLTAAVWIAPDGRGWQRAADHADLEDATMSGVAAMDGGWAAVGSGAWTSADGRSWTRVPASLAPKSEFGGAELLTWAGDRLVAMGTIAGSGGSTAAAWVSDDGTSWTFVPQQGAFGGETSNPYRLITGDGLVLAVGVRWTAPDHDSPTVWLATR